MLYSRSNEICAQDRQCADSKHVASTRWVPCFPHPLTEPPTPAASGIQRYPLQSRAATVAAVPRIDAAAIWTRQLPPPLPPYPRPAPPYECCVSAVASRGGWRQNTRDRRGVRSVATNTRRGDQLIVSPLSPRPVPCARGACACPGPAS